MPWLVFAVALGAILTALAGLAARVRRRGVGHQLSGPVDMIFRPHTHDLSMEIAIQQERTTPQLPADGKLRSDVEQ